MNKNNISEIRTFSQPPPAIVMVLEAVCVLLEEKTDWDSAKKVLKRLWIKVNVRQWFLRKALKIW